MKRFFIFFALVILVGFTSCNKDEDEAEKRSIPLIKTIKSIASDGSAYYSRECRYDGKGRLVELSDDWGDTVLIVYPSEILVKVIARNRITEYVLDRTGRATQIKYIESDGSFEIQNVKYRDGFMEYENEIHTVIDGNIVKTFYTDSEYAEETIYTYYTDKINTKDLKNMGIYFLGNDNKNPVKTITYKSTRSVNDNSYSYLHTYEFDSKGRITKDTEIDDNPVKMQRMERKTIDRFLKRVQNVSQYTYTN